MISEKAETDEEIFQSDYLIMIEGRPKNMTISAINLFHKSMGIASFGYRRGSLKNVIEERSEGRKNGQANLVPC